MKIKSNLKLTILIYGLLPIFVIYAISIGWLSSYHYKETLSQAQKLAESNARDIAQRTSLLLNRDIWITQTMGEMFKGIETSNPQDKIRLCHDMTQKILETNSDYLGVWFSWQLKYIDAEWKNDYGRLRNSMFYNKGKIDEKVDKMDLNGEPQNGLYHKIRLMEKTTITDPYKEDYDGRFDQEILTTSVCVPIIKNQQFQGLVGIDISLERYQHIISKLESIQNENIILFSEDGQIIASKDQSLLGKQFNITTKDNTQQTEINQQLRKGQQVNYTIQSATGDSFYSIAPIKLGHTEQTWGIAIIVPVESILAKSQKTLLTAITLGIIGLLLIGGIMFKIIHQIVTPIRKMVDLTTKVGNGDLTISIQTHRKDELGQMANSFNIMIQHLKNTIQNIQASAHEVFETSEHLKKDVDWIAQRAASHATTMQEVSTTMTEIEQSSHNSAKHATMASDMSLKAATAIQMGSKTVTEANEALAEIVNGISVVNDIAIQTNILALNAAVEAARAGERGKGFAVIATEVRKLAEKCQAASSQISQLATDGTNVADKAVLQMQQIAPEIEATSQSVMQISTNSESQQSAINQINSAINELNFQSQKNAHNAEKMAQYASKLGDKAEELNKNTSFFKVL